MSYGFSNTFRLNKNGDIIENLSWNSSNSRWEGTDYYLYLQGLTPTLARWMIRALPNGVSVAYGQQNFNPDDISQNNPEDSTYGASDLTNDIWTVTEISTGAQGDPHINPLFGKKYTI